MRRSRAALPARVILTAVLPGPKDRVGHLHVVTPWAPMKVQQQSKEVAGMLLAVRGSCEESASQGNPWNRRAMWPS
ncbi:hypothetical protein NDU88_002422 [Pleurodeles waltl]|uniref:Uncharacterized protein n=1 Tax=Pleurodeles waltl TaxID=8319 RepID=A0AAV7VB84_PLEWA|nr:hypothetical protein NDU88_002422 [Pleurodeles waltl]